MSALTYPHIEINAKGVPVISGTRMKVVDIVESYLAHHWRPEDICGHYPHLSLAQVHAAFTYYYDHREEIERAIEERTRRVADFKAKYGDNTIRDKLRRLGHLP
jgi:uncharacterized protein (DUF433 family)